MPYKITNSLDFPLDFHNLKPNYLCECDNGTILVVPSTGNPVNIMNGIDGYDKGNYKFRAIPMNSTVTFTVEN